VRFFMLQAHYRSIVDISEKALVASEKGFHRLLDAIVLLEHLIPSETTTGFELQSWKQSCYQAMNDDFNSPLLIAHLFDVVKFINSVSNEKQQISSTDLEALKSSMHAFFFEVLGLTQPDASKISTNNTQLEGTLALLLEIRNKARVSKDFATSDLIRDALLKLNIQINDSPEGSSFKIN